MQLLFTRFLHNFIIYLLRVDIMDRIKNNWDCIVSSLGQLNEWLNNKTDYYLVHNFELHILIFLFDHLPSYGYPFLSTPWMMLLFIPSQASLFKKLA